MPTASQPFELHRSGGVRHPPAADIESIRDLLRGYGSPGSILKELIQNAEDAGASSLHVVQVSGHPTATHSLLRGPGLLVANDGGFAQEHRDAITQISLGTKATEERAIGRFGKGLKGVFAWCEAFFIIARTSPEKGWPQTPLIADLFNPWYPWRHRDWCETFLANAAVLSSEVDRLLAPVYPDGKPWLAFWFPLRRHEHAQDQEGPVPLIVGDSRDLPGETPSEFHARISDELGLLAPSLVSLRSLEEIRVVNRDLRSAPTVVWEFPPQSQRIPEPDGPVGVLQVAGQTVLRRPNSVPVINHYCGFAGRLPDDKVDHIKHKPGWPQVVGRTREQSDAGCWAKGEPHFGTLISYQSHPAGRASGRLEIRWCVFFPVAKQPLDASPISLPGIPHHITINLHGFFFLDSERVRIDGLEDRFTHNGATGHQSCLEWNRIVATQGTLTRLPGALAAFAQQEALNALQCHELANAFRGTWAWNAFRREICQLEAWRPRWRSGVETWECLPSNKPVLPLPDVSNSRELLACVPDLGPISETEILTVCQPDSSMPGLHNAKMDIWPEDLVLRLLRNARLDAAADEEEARWINRFLDLLCVSHPLSEAVLAQASLLPLLWVSDAKSKSPRRISVREWNDAHSRRCLFVLDQTTDSWVAMLSAALPTWSCYIADPRRLPRWFTGRTPATCNPGHAAEIILNEHHLAGFFERVSLINAFASLAGRDARQRLAMRYLVHGDIANQHDDFKTLFLPSPAAGQHVWSRLIEKLLLNDGGIAAWQLLNRDWASALNIHLQGELRISTIDAQGAWDELSRGHVNLNALEFPQDQWDANDISTLLQGLFQAGQSTPDLTAAMLRRLRVHTLRNQRDRRVSVADEAGNLGELFVLDKPGFDAQLPAHLHSLWQNFLTETKIVERLPDTDLASTVQSNVFKQRDTDGTETSAELSWNYVVRRCLESADPSICSPLILQGFAAQGDTAAAGLGKKLRSAKWIPLALGGAIAPECILNIEGIEADLSRLLDPSQDGIAGVLAVAEWVRDHEGFPTLRKNLPRLGDALELLGMWLTERPDWHLGITDPSNPEDMEPILLELEEVDQVPVAALLIKLCRVQARSQETSVNSLIEKHIVPAVCRRFDYEHGGADRFESLLRRLQDHQHRRSFDAYLRQASSDGILAPMLPRLSLVSQRGHWVQAAKLIWPSANVDAAVQLCKEQSEILTFIHHEQAKASPRAAGTKKLLSRKGGNQLAKVPDFSVQTGILTQFLQSFRTGNIGDNLPAALVAVLGGHSTTVSLLCELLNSGLKQKPDVFLENLLGEDCRRLAQTIEPSRFMIEVVRGDATEATTVTGDTIQVQLTSEIDTLVVGDPKDLWRRYFYGDTQDAACHILRLRWVEHPDELPDPVATFTSTIETVLIEAHCNGMRWECPRNLKEFLGDIADAGQSDLRRSQSYLLDIAEAHLKELGIRGVPVFDGILAKFRESRQARLDAEGLDARAPQRARELAKNARDLQTQARDELLRLLEEPDQGEARRVLVDAVRRKMTDFDYRLSSVAPELFQNADDAVAELLEMRGSLEPQEQQFFVQFREADRSLQIVHWGRPINRHECPGFSRGVALGYDQDLQKMLTLNFSDKGVETGDRAPSVTGRFGLGFKSVFFVADQPEVISGRLAFQIRGGFYPVALLPAAAEELRGTACSLGAPNSVPTAIRLPLAEGIDTASIADAIQGFGRIAALLTVFSRQVRALTITQDSETSCWTNTEKALTPHGGVVHAQVGNRQFICFRCPIRTDRHPASVLFELGPGGIVQLPDELSGLWITTPTGERSDLRWALNAPFKPDAGRQRLALNSPENAQVAEEIAGAFGRALVELFDETAGHWEEFAEKLDIQRGASPQSWWRQLWRETTRRSPVLSWTQIRDGGQVLGWVAWGKPSGAMRRLIHDRSAVPSELPGAYETLAKLADLRFQTAGILAQTENGVFSHVAGWKRVQEAFPAGQIVHERIGTFLREAELRDDLERVTIELVLVAEIGPQHRVNEVAAEHLGAMFRECDAVFATNTKYATEVDGLLGWMRELRFPTESGGHELPRKLICGRALQDVIEPDEVIRAAFAPPTAVLSSKFSDTALLFFARARGQLAANAGTLAEWARGAKRQQMPAVLKYIADGDLGQQLADQLGRTWFETLEGTPAFQDLHLRTRSEIQRKFARGQVWAPPPVQPAPPLVPTVTQLMHADEALICLSEWWNAERPEWVATYEEKTYPPGFPGDLPWPSDDAWEADSSPSAQSRWLLMFVHAALVPLGFNSIGRDQSFSRFLVDDGWLETFCRATTEPEAILAAVDRYLDKFIEHTQFHFQMRQFVAFYAVAANLESLLESLRQKEHLDIPGAFKHVFSLRADPTLSATGIEAPPLTDMLGIGTCHLLRELYRLGRLSNPRGFSLAFTPIRKVRRLCTQLFGIPEGVPRAQSSEVIFSELSSLARQLNVDPTFNRCFDLPLQFLAQDEELRTRVLGQAFAADGSEDGTLDAAPHMETLS